MNIFKRKEFACFHPEANSPKIIKAFSIDGAKKKMRSFVVSKMFGDWVFFSNAQAVDTVMNDVVIEEIK